MLGIDYKPCVVLTEEGLNITDLAKPLLETPGLNERQRNCAEITELASQEAQERLTLPLQAHRALLLQLTI